MVLRISTQSLQNDRVRVILEGRLHADTVAELLQSVASVPAGTTLEFDVSGLTWLDDSGVRALQELHRKGARIVGGSLYVRRILQENSK